MADPVVAHATTVAFLGKAVLILGPSGSGKSGLALELMALGAELVADDRTELLAQDGQIIARCPPAIRGKIEARFVGILNARPAGPTPVAFAVDLSQTETERMPASRQMDLIGVSVPVVHKSACRSFPAAVLQYLRSGIASDAQGAMNAE